MWEAMFGFFFCHQLVLKHPLIVRLFFFKYLKTDSYIAMMNALKMVILWTMQMQTVF